MPLTAVIGAERVSECFTPHAFPLCLSLCLSSGLASRTIAEYGWQARLTLEVSGQWWLPAPMNTLDVYFSLPLLLGHSYSLWTEFMVVDCLVLLFVGGLLFPFLVPASSVCKFGPLCLSVKK